MNEIPKLWVTKSNLLCLISFLIIWESTSEKVFKRNREKKINSAKVLLIIIVNYIACICILLHFSLLYFNYKPKTDAQIGIIFRTITCYFIFS